MSETYLGKGEFSGREFVHLDIDLDDFEVQCIAGQRIYIEKEFGPTVFCGLRVTADTLTAEWIVEAEFISQDDKGNDNIHWEEVYRVDAQWPVFGEQT